MRPALTWSEPSIEPLLRELGLDMLVELAGGLDEPALARLARPPSPLTNARTRRLYRLALPADGGDMFVKLQVARPSALPPRKWLSYATKPSPLLREALAAHALSELGFGTPPIVAAGARGRFPATVRAVLITRAVPGTRDLEALFAEAPAVATSSVHAVEAAVAKLHAAGFALGGARYRDFLVPAGGATSPDEVVFLDAASFGRGARRRARDLRQLAAERGAHGLELH
jgi:hypothetical protein